jgi:hypothetical protein
MGWQKASASNLWVIAAHYGGPYVPTAQPDKKKVATNPVRRTTQLHIRPKYTTMLVCAYQYDNNKPIANS